MSNPSFPVGPPRRLRFRLNPDGRAVRTQDEVLDNAQLMRVVQAAVHEAWPGFLPHVPGCADVQEAVLTALIGKEAVEAARATVPRDRHVPDAATPEADLRGVGLDAAWQRAEAALPEGWIGPDLTPTPDTPGTWSATAFSRRHWEGNEDNLIDEWADTPAAALNALAEKLEAAALIRAVPQKVDE